MLLARFIKDIFLSRSLIVSMTKRDIKNSYSGSLFGFFWMFFQPLVTILVMWFVFQVGFKAGDTTGNVPFALWLVSGVVPWFFFSGAVSSATQSIVEQSNIVKKIVFNVSILPIVKIAAGLIVHLFFILVTAAICYLYGYKPVLAWLQIPYYLFCGIMLAVGISWLTSSIMVFFKDIGQFISVVLQLGFWGTPIFWNISMIGEKYHWIFKLNPVFYFVEGYRDALIYNRWFWHNMEWTLYFWFFTLFILFLGSMCFNKLKPHFADVL